MYWFNYAIGGDIVCGQFKTLVGRLFIQSVSIELDFLPAKQFGQSSTEELFFVSLYYTQLEERYRKCQENRRISYPRETQIVEYGHSGQQNEHDIYNDYPDHITKTINKTYRYLRAKPNTTLSFTSNYRAEMRLRNTDNAIQDSVTATLIHQLLLTKKLFDHQQIAILFVAQMYKQSISEHGVDTTNLLTM